MKVYRLWEGAAPGALGSDEADTPTLSDYGVPGSQVKSACVVCPGGGYAGLADYEGRPVAEWLERIGVRGFVLKYRLGPKYHHPIMLHDAERAIRMVRSRAMEFGVDSKRVGILGFSAGGHLASTVSTHSSDGDPSSPDPIDKLPSHPDWAVLLYPVINLKPPYGHMFSREMLLGKAPSERDIEGLSTENAVSLTTPPSFLCHGADDKEVPVQNSLGYAKALADHRRPFELYVPHHGPHGFALGEPGSEQDWTPMCEKWLRAQSVV